MKRNNLILKLVVAAAAVFLLTWNWSLHRRLGMLETSLPVEVLAPTSESPSAADHALVRRVRRLEHQAAKNSGLAQRIDVLEDLATVAQVLAARTMAAYPSLVQAFAPPTEGVGWPLLARPAEQLPPSSAGLGAGDPNVVVLVVEEPTQELCGAEPWVADAPPAIDPRVVWLESEIRGINAKIESLKIRLQMTDRHPRLIELRELRGRFERALATEWVPAQEHPVAPETLTETKEPQA